MAVDGDLTVSLPPVRYPETLRRTVQLLRQPTPADFRIPTQGNRRRVRVLELIPDQIVNRAGEAELAVVDGALQPDLENDVLPIFCVERYGINGNIGRALIHGFGLNRGAIAGSVAHDHHNIMVVGTNPEDMHLAVAVVASAQGGFVVAAGGEIQARLPLPLCGLMSERRMAEVDTDLAAVRRAARDIGCSLRAPFMTLSFVSLPTVPDLGITDRGLIDVHGHKIVPLFIE